MQKLQIKIDPITEEQVSDLFKFLDTGVVPEGTTEPRLAMLYWRLRANWEKLDKAEEWIGKDLKKKRESYKWRIINEIQQWLQDFKNENWLAWHYEYEIANIKEWESWRTMQIWIRDIDVNDNVKRRHSVLIEECYNPEFFEEMLQKYMPKEMAISEEKPF